MPSSTESGDAPLQACETRGCDRIAAVSATSNFLDWYRLCGPCSAAFAQGTKDIGGTVTTARPPYPHAEVETMESGVAPWDRPCRP